MLDKRTKQLYEFDQILFGNTELPVLIPSSIMESQKALINNKSLKSSFSKKKAQAAAAMAEMEATANSNMLHQDLSGGDPTRKASPTRKKKSFKNSMSMKGTMDPNATMNETKKLLSQGEIDKMMQYLCLEFEDTKKSIYNSINRIQNLMSLDVMFVNKASELKQLEHNEDLYSSQEQLLRERANAAIEANSEPKGALVTIPVNIKGVDVTYVMRMGEETIPIFHFLPRGREIIHRLILKAANVTSLEELQVTQTRESTMRSIIFQRQQP